MIENEKKHYLCNVCGHRSFYKFGIDMHMKRHNRDPKEKPHKCSHCKFATVSRHYFVTHMRVKHDINMPLLRPQKKGKEILQKCEQCDYSTFVRTNLLIHLRRHTGETPYKCDQCPYEGRQRIILTLHKRSVHEKVFFECEQCEYKASQKSNLKTHIHVRHGGKHHLRERCTVCGDALEMCWSAMNVNIRRVRNVI